MHREPSCLLLGLLKGGKPWSKFNGALLDVWMVLDGVQHLEHETFDIRETHCILRGAI